VDFWRLCSFYFGGIGHYLSSVLTVNAILLLIYLMTCLALYNEEKIGDRPIVPQGLLQVRRYPLPHARLRVEMLATSRGPALEPLYLLQSTAGPGTR
jgi:hypothetical protein